MTETTIKTIADLSDEELANAVRDFTASTTIAKSETFVLPMKDFPIVSLQRFIAYGAQRCINDAVGGADKTAEAKVDQAKALIVDYKMGNISKRRAGTGVDPVTKVARELMRDAFKAACHAKGQKDKIKQFTSLERDEQLAKLDEWLELEQFQGLRKKAEKQIADKAKAAAEVDLGDLEI